MIACSKPDLFSSQTGYPRHSESLHRYGSALKYNHICLIKPRAPARGFMTYSPEGMLPLQFLFTFQTVIEGIQ
ncbi:hypothetical protein ASZ90_020253 [hydrocarbon metagenome]|uniref:Uncharacterized protein n=1 Tax=hydrocarbon metagenome TaxID=938273 RepID=A0A0W8E237_9ZZZZ